MTSTTYFLLLTITLLSLCTYFVIMSFKIPLLEFNSDENTEPKDQQSKFSINNLSLFKSKEKDPICNNDQFETSITEVDIEIKKLRGQLKRNLRTLNYISNLESTYCSVKDSNRLKDVINLKENLEREIIRNTKLLNHFSLKAS